MKGKQGMRPQLDMPVRRRLVAPMRQATPPLLFTPATLGQIHASKKVIRTSTAPIRSTASSSPNASTRSDHYGAFGAIAVDVQPALHANVEPHANAANIPRSAPIVNRLKRLSKPLADVLAARDEGKEEGEREAGPNMSVTYGAIVVESSRNRTSPFKASSPKGDFRSSFQGGPARRSDVKSPTAIKAIGGPLSNNAMQALLKVQDRQVSFSNPPSLESKGLKGKGRPVTPGSWETTQ
jgi:hypothetical protein